MLVGIDRHPSSLRSLVATRPGWCTSELTARVHRAPAQSVTVVTHGGISGGVAVPPQAHLAAPRLRRGAQCSQEGEKAPRGRGPARRAVGALGPGPAGARE